MPAPRNRRGWLPRLAAAAVAGPLLAACGGGNPTPLVPSPEARVEETASEGAARPPADPSQAATLLRNGDYEQAARAFEAAASSASSPDARADAFIGLARARYGDDDLDGAVQAARDAADAATEGSAVEERALFLLGVRTLEAGDPEAAAEPLGELADREGSPLAAHAQLEHGRALRHANERDDASARLEALAADTASPEPLRQEALRELAAVAADDGDLEAYEQRLRDAIAGDPDPALSFQLAGVVRERGDAAGANALLRELVASSPDSRHAALAIAELEEAGEPVGALPKGLVLYRRSSYAEAQALFAPAVADPAASGLHGEDLARATYYLAASYDDGEKPDLALPHYDAVIALAQGTDLEHRARFWAARIVEASGDAASASARYLDMASGPAGEFSGEAAFRAGHVHWRAGDAAAAATAWEAAGQTDDARVLYWKGRAFEALGDSEAAVLAFTAARDAGPLGFFGQQAAANLADFPSVAVTYRERTYDLAVDWAAIEAWLTESVPAESHSAPPAAAELGAAGLNDRARETLEASAADDAPWKLYAGMRDAHALGLTDTAAGLAVRLRDATGASWTEAPQALMRVAYPLTYVDLVDSEAAANDIDPLLLAALIRQESFWRPDAHSHADARGLTQVIPATGEGLAKALGVDRFDVDDLFRPVVSIRFGARYFGDLLDRFEGSAAEALAGYNGGPENVAGWRAAARGSAVADFVEAIDFEETRQYVIAVLEFYAHYQAAWEE